MFFTRTNDTFRGWISVVTSDGMFRSGALSSSFIATIINPLDTAFVSSSVTQSLQKPGLYRFDIPSSFLTTHGPGEYAISVEVDIDTTPVVTTNYSEVLRVSTEDFDTLISGTWSALTSSYQENGTMGYYQVFPIVTVSASISASVDVASIVSGVWNASTASFATVGTMGYALGSISGSLFQMSGTITQISSALGLTYGALLQVSGTTALTYNTLLVVSSTVNQISNSIVPLANALYDLSSSVSNITSGSIAQAVWNEQLSIHSLSGSTGKAFQEVSVRLHEIYQILGLESGNPMTVTQTLRAVSALSQSISGDPNTAVTVTRLG